MSAALPSTRIDLAHGRGSVCQQVLGGGAMLRREKTCATIAKTCKMEHC